MKFYKKRVANKKMGCVDVYIPVEIPIQLRHMDASNYQRVILGNSDGFEFLRDVFLVAHNKMSEKSMFYIPDNSIHGERYEQWLSGVQHHMSFIIINCHSFVGKPKYIKQIIDKTKYIEAEVVELESDESLIEDLPCWKLENAYQMKTHGKSIICSSNELGLIDLASLANRFVGLEDIETTMCDYHIHLGHFKDESSVATDFWYYYESHESDIR